MDCRHGSADKIRQHYGLKNTDKGGETGEQSKPLAYPSTKVVAVAGLMWSGWGSPAALAVLTAGWLLGM